MPQYSYGVPDSPDELERLGQVLVQSFGFAKPGRSPSETWQDYRELVGPENFRCLRIDSRVVAGLGVYRVGQWFGGRSVPMYGVAAVGVAPEVRGMGVATRLMGELMVELHAAGVPLSTLYASTGTLYHKSDFEWAGTSCRFELPVARIGTFSRELPLERVEPSDPIHPGVRASFERWVRGCSGPLDRDDIMWKRLTRSLGSPVYAYIAGSITAPEGHVIFTQSVRPGEGYDLCVRDLVATTPSAAHRLWALFSDHRSLGRSLRWTGPCTDPMLALALESKVRVVDMEYWMTRLVDVPGALSQRGYPEGVEDTLHLDVTDPLLAANHDRFVLRVGGGRGEVTRGGTGDLAISVRALAPLFTGLYSARQLAGLGWLQGAEGALAAAERIFAGPEPWMAVHF